MQKNRFAFLRQERDGFFLVGRQGNFQWRDLEKKKARHGPRPLGMAPTCDFAVETPCFCGLKSIEVHPPVGIDRCRWWVDVVAW